MISLMRYFLRYNVICEEEIKKGIRLYCDLVCGLVVTIPLIQTWITPFLNLMVKKSDVACDAMMDLFKNYLDPLHRLVAGSVYSAS